MPPAVKHRALPDHDSFGSSLCRYSFISSRQRNKTRHSIVAPRLKDTTAAVAAGGTENAKDFLEALPEYPALERQHEEVMSISSESADHDQECHRAHDKTVQAAAVLAPVDSKSHRDKVKLLKEKKLFKRPAKQGNSKQKAHEDNNA